MKTSLIQIAQMAWVGSGMLSIMGIVVHVVLNHIYLQQNNLSKIKDNSFSILCLAGFSGINTMAILKGVSLQPANTLTISTISAVICSPIMFLAMIVLFSISDIMISRKKKNLLDIEENANENSKLHL